MLSEFFSMNPISGMLIMRQLLELLILLRQLTERHLAAIFQKHILKQ
jgi:hypothetical protein